jgi:ferredoxin-NADP reductase
MHDASAARDPARSISSSSAVAADEVAICVGRLAYKLANGQERSGFCSSWLSNLQEGDTVRFKLISQPVFCLPLNLAAPVVMVAAGTGLAPFRVSQLTMFDWLFDWEENSHPMCSCTHLYKH